MTYYHLIGAAMVGATLMLVIVALTMRSGRDSQDERHLDHELDAIRLDFLERSQSTVMFDRTRQAWGVINDQNIPASMRVTLRGAVDAAAGISQGRAPVMGPAPEKTT